MLRKLLSMAFAVAFIACIAGCEDNDVKITEKKEVQTETTPTDAKPGEMIVE